MNLLKINDILTKGTIGIFISVVLFTLLAIVAPILTYFVAVLIIILAISTVSGFLLSSYLIVQQINKIIEILFIQFLEHEKQRKQG